MDATTRPVDAEEAFLRMKESGEVARWPSRGDGCRLEPIARPYIFPKFVIELTDRVFTIGSCFARNIEEYLDRFGLVVPTYKFSVPAQEFAGRANGILNKYTPGSVYQEIDRARRYMLASSESERLSILSETLLEIRDGEFIDVELVGHNAVTYARAIERRKQVTELFVECFNCEVVTITLGLIEAWFDNLTGRFIQRSPNKEMVSKCPGRFKFVLLSFNECLDYVRKTISIINEVGGVKKIILTTSPVPLSATFVKSDVILMNQHAKSVLRAVCGEVSCAFETVDYFPSYEMVVLSKDRSVWQDDLIHVSDQFVGQIVSQLMQAYMPGHENKILNIKQAWAALIRKEYDVVVSILQNEKDAASRCVYGLMLTQSGNKEEGNRLITQHAKEAALDLEQAMKISSFLYRNDKYKLCMDVIDNALHNSLTNSNDVQFTATLVARKALCLQKTGHSSESSILIAEALKKRRSVTVLVHAGTIAFEQGDMAAAQEFFQEILDTIPDNGIPSKYRGTAYAWLAYIAYILRDYGQVGGVLEKARFNHPRFDLIKKLEGLMRS